MQRGLRAQNVICFSSKHLDSCRREFKQTMGIKVAIVVSADRRQLLETNLPSLTDQSLRFDRIIVVDNGSRDGTAKFCSRLPGIEVLSLKRNLGFAGGVNQGLMLALADASVDQVALINNDVRLHADWHAEATRALSLGQCYGSVATCLLKTEAPGIVDTAGITWTPQAKPENHLAGQPAPPCSSEPEEIFGACAGAALYSRAFFDTVGLFDASLFAYQEDVDLALRGQSAGWRCVFAPAARGWHLGFGTNRPFPFGGTYADFLNSRNRLAVLVQSLDGQQWRKHWHRIITAEVSSAARSLGEGRGPAVIAGLVHALWWLPSRLQRRRRLRRIRCLIANGAIERNDDASWCGLTVAMITKDAIKSLPGALATIPRQAQLLVADGGSQDGSQLLAKAAGAVVVYQDPIILAGAGGNFDLARNQLMNNCKGEWILFLDADERLTDSVRAEVPTVLKSSPSAVAYDIPRVNLFWGRPVRLLGEDRQVRLLKCGCSRWAGHALHQRPQVNGSVEQLSAPILHNNVMGWTDLIDRFRRYLPIEFRTRSGPTHILSAMLVPWRFFRFYYLHQESWRDGGHGLLVAFIYTTYQTLAEWGAGVRRLLTARPKGNVRQ